MFGASTPGGRTYFAMMGPTGHQESGRDRLEGAFDHLRSNVPPKAGLHYASLSRTGDYVAVPSGYWHTVLSEGFRVCVSYFDRALDDK